MSTLDQFIAAIKTDGLARNNRFSINLNFPVSVDADQRKVNILCDTVTMPGINLNTTTQRIWGEHRELPYEALYDTVTFTFYVNKTLDVKNLFEAWISTIRDPSTRSFSYYRNYITDIDINVHPLDSYEQVVHSVTLHEAYPKTLSSVQLDYSSHDTMKYSVSMMYKYYTTQLMTTQQAGIPMDQYNQDPSQVTTGLGYETSIGAITSSNITDGGVGG